MAIHGKGDVNSLPRWYRLSSLMRNSYTATARAFRRFKVQFYTTWCNLNCICIDVHPGLWIVRICIALALTLTLTIIHRQPWSLIAPPDLFVDLPKGSSMDGLCCQSLALHYYFCRSFSCQNPFYFCYLDLCVPLNNLPSLFVLLYLINLSCARTNPTGRGSNQKGPKQALGVYINSPPGGMHQPNFGAWALCWHPAVA